jgi:HEAT repeat protein
MTLLAALLLAIFADDKEVEDAVQKFKSAMKSPDVSARVNAVTELGRIQHERTMKVLSSCLLTDDKLVRVAAAKALASFQEKKAPATALLVDALGPNAKEPDVQAEILSALKELREEAALSAAYQYLESKSFKVAEAAIALTGAIRSKRSIDLLIRLMKKLATAGDGVTSGDGSFDVPADEAVRERARKLQSDASKALQSITGEKFSSVSEWDAWWKRNAALFRVKD